MRLTIWDIFIFLYRHKFVIAAAVVLSFVLSYAYVDHIQTYSAEVIIRYKDDCISDGYTRDGNKFDPNEIVAPKVIVNANANLPFNITDDDVRANTTITPIISANESALQDAKLKQAEAYEYHSNAFRVSYRGNASFFETRDTLDRLIESYFEYYNEKYIYLATISEIDYELNQGDFDYIEQADILQDNIDQAISVLRGYTGVGDYRSPVLGLSFNDLINELTYLSQFKMPQIFSKIYAARLSKNTSLLLDKYTERKEQHELNAKNAYEKAVLAEDRMNAYVDANVDVPNSYNDSVTNGRSGAVILDRVEDDWDRRHLDEQTTYDDLILSYVTDSITVDHQTIDAQECEKILGIFSTPADEGVNYAQYQQDVEEDIDETLAKLKELYSTAFILIDDYNSYIPQLHIESLTGVRTYQNVYRAPYVLLAVTGALVLSCIAAVVYEILVQYARYTREARRADAGNQPPPEPLDDEFVSADSIIPDISLDNIEDIPL